MIRSLFCHAKLNRIALRHAASALLASLALQLPQTAFAWIDVSLTPIYGESNTSVHNGGGSFPGEGAVGTLTKTGYDVRATLGFVLLNHILIGGSINSSSSTAQRPQVGNDTEASLKESRMEYGPTLGLVYDGFHFSFTYLMSGKRNQSLVAKDTAGAVSYNGDFVDKDGAGYQFKLGYAFHVTQNFLLGPTLVYRQVTYAKQDYTNNIGSGSYSDKSYDTKPVEGSLEPFITAILTF